MEWGKGSKLRKEATKWIRGQDREEEMEQDEESAAFLSPRS